MIYYFDTNNSEELDTLLLPYTLYDHVINKEKLFIEVFLFTNPQLLYSIINFNNTIQKSYNLLKNNKTGCNYKLQWITYNFIKIYTLGNFLLDNSNSILKINQYSYDTLSFLQQCTIFYYMKTKLQKSNMQYLFNISYNIYIDYLNFINLYNNNTINNSNLLNRKYYYKSNISLPTVISNYNKYIVKLQQL